MSQPAAALYIQAPTFDTTVAIQRYRNAVYPSALQALFPAWVATA
jgi:hypothetical protein